MNEEVIKLTQDTSDLDLAKVLMMLDSTEKRAKQELEQVRQSRAFIQSEIVRREQLEAKKLSYENKDKKVGAETMQPAEEVK